MSNSNLIRPTSHYEAQSYCWDREYLDDILSEALSESSRRYKLFLGDENPLMSSCLELFRELNKLAAAVSSHHDPTVALSRRQLFGLTQVIFFQGNV